MTKLDYMLEKSFEMLNEKEQEEIFEKMEKKNQNTLVEVAEDKDIPEL